MTTQRLTFACVIVLLLAVTACNMDSSPTAPNRASGGDTSGLGDAPPPVLSASCSPTSAAPSTTVVSWGRNSLGRPVIDTSGPNVILAPIPPVQRIHVQQLEERGWNDITTLIPTPPATTLTAASFGARPESIYQVFGLVNGCWTAGTPIQTGKVNPNGNVIVAPMPPPKPEPEPEPKPNVED